jgi:prophage regulatory protein
MKVLRLNNVVAKTGLGRARIYEQMHEGTFPRPIPLGVRARGWLEHEVDAWIEQMTAQRGENNWRAPQLAVAAE